MRLRCVYVSVWLAVSLGGLVPAGMATAEVISGTSRVVDGDTLDLGETRVRLAEIDAPERGQAGGAAATAFLRRLVDGRQVECHGAETGYYGRLIAVCHADGRDLNATMVAHGHAAVSLRYGDTYADLQAAARAARRGLWAAADPVMPWTFRANRRQAAVASVDPPDPGCRIKGNIGSGGARIYHMKTSPWYARTRIDPHSGERWFCTEGEARAAGWRAPNL